MYSIINQFVPNRIALAPSAPIALRREDFWRVWIEAEQTRGRATMDWTDYAAIAALAVSLANLIMISGIVSDVRGVTRTVDRQLVEIRGAGAR